MTWMNRRTTIIFSAIALIGVKAPAAQAASFTFTAGIPDNFSQSNGVELATPSQGLSIYRDNHYYQNNHWLSRNYIAHFDSQSYNKTFAHTFDVSAVSGTIQSAQLEIKLRSLGSGLEYNDSIYLWFVDETGNRDTTAWGRRIGSDSSAEGLLPTLWSNNSVATFNLDLANLPLASNQDPNLVARNLISALNSKRFLDVYVTDDTAVDYITLNIETSPNSNSVPEPATTLGLFGLGLLGATRRMFQKTA